MLIEGTGSTITVRQMSTWDQLMWSVMFLHLWVTYEQNKRLMSQKEGKEKAQSRVRGKSDGAGLGASLNGELQAG